MIALHISILDGVPLLWSEGKKIGMLKELRLAMGGIGMISLCSNTTKEFCVWLPGRGEKPRPSSPLIGTMPDIDGEEILKAFPITALRLNSTTLFELSQLSEKGNIPGSCVIFGNSIIWTRQVRKIALNIIRSESLLPSMLKNKTFREALWHTLTDTATSIALEKLAATMPAVCRSLSRTNTQPPEVPKGVVLRRLLSFIVNTLVRPPEKAGTPKITEFESIHDAWLHALLSSDARVTWKNE